MEHIQENLVASCELDVSVVGEVYMSKDIFMDYLKEDVTRTRPGPVCVDS